MTIPELLVLYYVAEPSPLCRFHITADSKPRRRHAPSVLQSPNYPNRTVLLQIRLDSNEVRRFDPKGMVLLR
ncbi:hypothetical protein PFLUV_G00122150 [Perca fluviatilis]|uniref:Uncharacterized protein n=1 Tax=Perca fluviatilis TaxID=8168 RepID=A0A6A5F2V3_PERFL|nr:hypothetical protein PFLUV_G00122150 [Perca fluviatilis]